MRHRWIRAAGLGPALLAVLLAVSPVPAVTARTVIGAEAGELQAHWFDPNVGKALRATTDPNRWEVLVQVEKDGGWSPDGHFSEVFRRRPEASKALDPAVKTVLDSLGTAVLIGEVRAPKGMRLYVVAAVLEQDSSLEDSDGQALQRFIPLRVEESYPAALRFAEVFEKLYDGRISAGELPGDVNKLPPGGPPPGTGCANACKNQRDSNLASCGVTYTLCGAAANAALVACALGCAGVPPCEAACAAGYLLWLAACVADHIGCQDTALQLYQLCLANCPSCTATEARTVTSVISLERETGLGRKIASRPLDFALSRAELRGEQSFVMDEWAVVKDGLVRSSSNPAFGLAVTTQVVAQAGWSLVVQEPVHDLNSRHVPQPEVRVSRSRLPRSERGRGEIVAARLEFSSATDVDRVAILYTSEPVEKAGLAGLEQLVSRRVGLIFESEKEHRTAVYVVFRLTDRLELLATHTAFPKCCCGGSFCG